MPALPRIVRQQGRTGGEIGERRGVGGRGLGALARDQIELGQLLTFAGFGDQGRAAVELIDDFEDGLFAFLRRGVHRQQPADPQMRRGAQVCRDQRIGGFLDPVMGEPVDAFQAQDQLLPDGLPQSRMDLLCSDVPGTMASVGMSATLPRQARSCSAVWVSVGQAGQLADHKVHHIVGVPLGVNAIEIPAPARRVMVERSKPSSASADELNGEKRIAPRLLVHQLRKRRGAAATRSAVHPRSTAAHPSCASGARLISCKRARFDQPGGTPRACASVDEQHRPRCRGRRRSAVGAAPPAGSVDPRADRASPGRAIANRQGRMPADDPAGRKPQETVGTPAGSGFVPAAAAAPGLAAVRR